MLTALSPPPSASPLPGLFPPEARQALFAPLAGRQAIRLASEVLVRTLNAIAIDPATRIPDGRITADRRFSLALGVAVPLSLQGRPARPARLLEVERRLAQARWRHGAAGPAGRALEAARLIAAAAAGLGAEAGLLARRSVDLAIEAEVLAACLQDRSLEDARARAEQRALDICNPPRRT